MCCMAHEAPIPEGSCDLITMFECLHDMHNPTEVLKQLKKYLRPKTGIVFVGGIFQKVSGIQFVFR